jgi:hypothetical protein
MVGLGEPVAEQGPDRCAGPDGGQVEQGAESSHGRRGPPGRSSGRVETSRQPTNPLEPVQEPIPPKPSRPTARRSRAEAGGDLLQPLGSRDLLTLPSIKKANARPRVLLAVQTVGATCRF